MTRDLSIAGLCERDVDLLVLEESIASPGFRALLIHSAGWECKLLDFVEAHRSVTHSNGESDLELVFSDRRNGEVRLLIENKVSAGFQPNQAERYRLRGRNYVEQGRCVGFATLLLAPARYLGRTESLKGFDSALTYEQLIEWFKTSDLGARASFKVAMLMSAVDRAVLGYQPQADDVVTGFWRAYWRTSALIAPELEMREPGGKPARSGFILFNPSGMPDRSRLLHKCNHGFVDLQLGGLGDKANRVARLLGPFLEKDMEVVRAEKSASVRIRVPQLSTARSFSDQEEQARQGLSAAIRLCGWARSVPEEIWFQVAGVGRK